MSETRKIVGIGDVHGLHSWEEIVKRHSDSHIVFLGDYCDPYNPYQPWDDVVNNLKAIIKLKQENPDRVTLILGNHDVHYFEPEAARGTRYNTFKAQEVRGLFEVHRELFVCAYEEGNLLFTHAGVSQAWYFEDFSTTSEHVAERLNNPEKYGCNGVARYYCGAARGGMHRHGGIYWADDSELAVPLDGYIHIVGHNRTAEIAAYGSYAEGIDSGIIFCDSLFNGNYLLIECDEEGRRHFYAANVQHDEIIELDNI